jgi:predicted phage terminase large subunit-like protein
MIELTPEVIEGFVKACLWPSFSSPAQIPDFHKELWELCCSSAPLVAIAAPRGHAKSTAISFSYVLAAALFRQAKYIILISDTEGQAVQFLGDIKKELLLNEDLRALFGVKEFEKETESDIIVRMDDGHRFRITAKGSEQRIRGSKWNGQRPDLIIGDDLENDEIVMNDERREKFRNWLIAAVLPSRDPVKGKVRLVGTILHLDSFLARVVPLEGFRNSIVDGFKVTAASKGAIWKGVLYKAHLGNNPYEITGPKDILWNSRFTKEHFISEYESAKEVGNQDKYFQEYLNKPLDESMAVFRKSDFVTATDEELQNIANGRMPLLYYIGGDLAITQDRKSDYTVFHVVGMNSEGIMYHIDTIRDRLGPKEIVDTLIALQQRYQPQWVAMEKEQIARTLMAYIHDAMLRTGIFINFVPDLVAHTDKRARAASIIARFRAKGIRFDKNAPYFPTLEAELLSFDRGIKDDQVDAYSCIGLGLNKMNHAQTYESILEDDLLEQEKEHTLGADGGRSIICGY